VLGWAGVGEDPMIYVSLGKAAPLFTQTVVTRHPACWLPGGAPRRSRCSFAKTPEASAGPQVCGPPGGVLAATGGGGEQRGDSCWVLKPGRGIRPTSGDGPHRALEKAIEEVSALGWGRRVGSRKFFGVGTRCKEAGRAEGTPHFDGPRRNCLGGNPTFAPGGPRELIRAWDDARGGRAKGPLRTKIKNTIWNFERPNALKGPTWRRPGDVVIPL